VRTILDTNIVVRALIRPGSSVAPVIRRLRANHYSLIYSRPLLEELLGVLQRDRIRVRYGLSDNTVRAIRHIFEEQGELVTPTQRITACRDPKDNMVLEAAVAGLADVIVSGDEDLLVLHPFEGIPIVGPAAFLRMLDQAT